MCLSRIAEGRAGVLAEQRANGNRTLCCFVVAVAISWTVGPVAGDAEYQVPTPEPVESPLLVGCYYFPGYFNAMRWRPMAQFGHPYPLLGYYRDGEPIVSDWHIKWAVEHGIDFFAFDWYYDYKTGRVHGHNRALEEGFLRARYRDMMKFCIFWCNEERGTPDYTEEQMLLLARTLRERYLKKPNYLKLDGKAVLIVSLPDRLIERFGVEGCSELWQRMSEEAGVELLPVAKAYRDQDRLARAGYRACTAYNYASVNLPQGARSAPYDTMVSGYEDIWRQATSDEALPYIVPLSPGWDSRPWYGEEAMVRTNPRPAKFRRMCEAAKEYIDPKLRAVIVECWNEFGEGSYIEPCTQYGFGYLDALRDAFCPDNPHHLDVTPQQLGVSAPVYSEIPRLMQRDIAAAGGNLMYNPGFEKDWGWTYYSGGRVRFDEGVARSGERSAVVTPDDGGLKSLWHVDVAPGQKLQIWAWVRAEEKATASVVAALFRDTKWLRRYLQIGQADETDWQKVAKTVTWEDAEANSIDIEVAPRDGRAWVDDVGIRLLGED